MMFIATVVTPLMKRVEERRRALKTSLSAAHTASATRSDTIRFPDSDSRPCCKTGTNLCSIGIIQCKHAFPGYGNARAAARQRVYAENGHDGKGYIGDPNPYNLLLLTQYNCNSFTTMYL